MLKQLRIEHIILVDSAILDFSEGLNVLTGETGSGKSAVIAALHLVLGDRASADIIRQGSPHATVEALFDIDKLPSITALLEEGGIQHTSGEYLIVRREVHAAGKSRAFINNQMAQLALLQKIGKALIDSVGQHANQRLQTLDYHRQVIDVFGGLEATASTFKLALVKEENFKEQLEALTVGEAARLREIEVCRREIEELASAALKESEEEELFAEYTLLANSEELSSLAQSITETLSGEGGGILSGMAGIKGTFDRLHSLDKSLDDVAQTFKGAFLELQEVSRSLNHYSGKIEYNPQRLDEINERLALINRLKRRYGGSVAEMCAYFERAKGKLDDMENADEKIEDLQKALSAAEAETHRIGKALTESRRQTAVELENSLVEYLRNLNMPHASFEVQVAPQKRTYAGDDKVEFFLAPNVGEKAIPLRSCASGGELSRVMLAVKALLAGKDHIPTLIFDEIDANIGGETASVVGKTLSEIGNGHQVICITHFPQVARHADTHIKISKAQDKGRTVTTIYTLSSDDREEELTRMLGGERFAVKV